MLWFSRRNRIIKKAVAKTVSAFADRMPKLYDHFFYGSVDIRPQNFVIWYLFETEAELKLAKTSGLCNELRETTVKNLISLGYPQEAFSKKTVSFTTIEDIDNKANGDYHLYFQ